MIQRKVTLHVEPTPQELAFEFSQMSDKNQAVFFNELARLVAEWEKPFCFQLQYITDHPALTSEGREVMRQIGEYGEVISPNAESEVSE